MLELFGSGRLVHATYLLGFILSALVCLGAACRARLVPDADTRRALTAFFLGSGAWAGAYVGFLLVDSALGTHLFYQLSLIVGFGTVWAWLWFCSAYSGRDLHRNRSAQWFAIVVFTIVTALKVTNPWHGLYYELKPSGGPLGLVVSHEMLYWVVMALAYALATAGYLMIYELFIRAEARVLPLAVLTGLTTLPAVLNVIGHANASVLDVTHEPLGVAVFAVGLLVVYETQFSIVHVSGSVEDPTLTVGSDGRIRGLGGGVVETVPPITREARGKPLAEVLPGLAEVLRKDRSVWAVPDESESRYYRVARTSFKNAAETKTIVLSEITEQRRREQALRRRRKKIEGLYETTNRLLRASSQAEVGEVLTQLIREVLGYGGVSVRFVDDGTLTVSQVAETTYEFMPERSELSVQGDSVLAEAYRTDETLVIDDLENAEIDDPNDYGDLRSGVVVPIGEYGTLAVASPEPDAISPFDRHMVEVLGTYGAAVLGRIDREKTLREERDLLDHLIETSPNAIVRLDREGTFVQARGRAEAVLGAEEEEILGRTYNDPEWGVATPEEESLPDEELPFAQVMSRGESIRGEEHSIQCPDGTRRILSVSGAPLSGASEDTTGAVFHLQDITERERRERRANRLRRTYQTILEGAPNAIFLADQETGQIEEVNQEAADLIGAAPEEIVGRYQTELHPDGETRRYRQLFKDVVRRGPQAGESETVSRFDDGSPLYVLTDAGEKVPVEISATTIDLEGRQLILGIFRT